LACGAAGCTVASPTLASGSSAAFGLVSPTNGTVVSWHVRAGASTTPAALRVIKRLGGGLSTGSGTSATVVPLLNDTSAFATQLPIAIGDSIGLDCCKSAAGAFFVGSSASLRETWEPPLVDGAAGRSPDGVDNREVAVSADIEPTSTFTAATKAKKGGKLRVTVTLPNPGTFTAGDNRDKALVAVAAGAKKPNFLKRTGFPVAAPGPVSLVVKPTKAARQALTEKDKLNAKLKLLFTPTGGSPATRVIKVKLKA
jgi:hypothetical protein